MLKPSQELELILCCIRNAPNPDFRPTDDFDWSFFVELVAKHKVENIVNSKLPLLVKNAPPKVRNIIHRLSNKAKIRNLLQVKLLKELVQAFDMHELKVLFIKGLTTYSLCPDEKYLRPARDIDFMIDWQDVELALAILSKMNFILLTKEYKKGTGSLDLRLKGTGMLIELHWNLWSKREEIPSNFPELWQNRVSISRYNIKIPTIDPVTHISYLCYHGSVHFWYRLFWLMDINFILNNKDINWQAVISRAKQKGSLPALYLAIALAADLFKTKVPEAFANNLMNKTRGMRQKIWEVWINNPDGRDFELNGIADRLQRVRWKLKIKSKYRARTLIKLLLAH